MTPAPAMAISTIKSTPAPIPHHHRARLIDTTVDVRRRRDEVLGGSLVDVATADDVGDEFGVYGTGGLARRSRNTATGAERKRTHDDRSVT